MATSKDRAAQALVEVYERRLDIDHAVAAVAAMQGVAPDVVVNDVRTCRYLVFNRTRPGPAANALLNDLPDDVIPIPWGATAGEEAAQMGLVEQLGAAISHLPALFAYEPAREVTVEEGRRTVPAGYRELRVPRDARWLDDAPPADRKRSVREWGLCRVPPPFEGEP